MTTSVDKANEGYSKEAMDKLNKIWDDLDAQAILKQRENNEHITALRTALAAPRPEPFVVKHYTADLRPTIKGNGFDGLEIGESREEAEEFVAWVNARIAALAAEQPLPSGTPIQQMVEEMIAESPEMAPYLRDARRQYILDAARYRRLRELLLRIREWDHLDSAADGPFWKHEIDKALQEDKT